MMSSSSRAISKLLSILGLGLIGGAVGAAFAYLGVSKSIEYLIYGFLDGLAITLLMGTYTLVIARRWVIPHLRRLPFAYKILFNSALYATLFVAGRAFGHVLRGASFEDFFSGSFAVSIALAFGLAMLLNFLLEVSALLGSTVVWSFVRGTYHQPIEEERYFLFIDLASSTALAEELGNKKFLGLLSRFFYDMGEAVLETGGEIYKYVGDEAIITWKVTSGSAPLECYFRFVALMEEGRERYIEDFGRLPSYRAGLHGGFVIAGELGEAKKEVAYLGDVVNTAARLMDLGKQKKLPLLVSEYVRTKIDVAMQERFSFEAISNETLRGKTESFSIYSVSKRS